MSPVASESPNVSHPTGQVAGETATVSSIAGRTVVGLHGVVDQAAVRLLADRLSEVIAQDDEDIVIDMSDVSFIDAAGLGALVRGADFLRWRDRVLTLRSASTALRLLAQIWSVTDLLEPDGKPSQGGAIAGGQPDSPQPAALPAADPERRARPH